jgi:phosphopantothenoylcysteine decarboxylase/phosphopantothenate--cysteine ligase
MGFAVAAAGARRGARVVLIAGPTTLEPPPGVEVVRVRSAADMRDAVISRADDADVVVMAAAVADYTPAEKRPQKITKEPDSLTVTLVRTPDILAELGRLRAGNDRPLLVGFAAETKDLLSRAREKRREKGADLIVANDVSRADAGFDVDTNEVTLLSADGEEKLPLQSKTAVADAILNRLEVLLRTRITAAR